jgi:hypothetical protein
MERKVHHILYKITNTQDGKFYVGAHSTEDLDDRYFGSGTRIIRAVKKYGRDAFIKEIVCEFENEFQMYHAERLLVDEDFIKRDDTYNIVVGGKGYAYNHEVSIETKAKIAKSSSKSMQSLERRNQIAEKLRGRIWSDEHVKNHSEIMSSPEMRKYLREKALGRITTEETKQKLKELMTNMIWIKKDGVCQRVKEDELPPFLAEGWVRGRIIKKRKPCTQETKDKMSKSGKEKVFTDVHKEHMRGKVHIRKEGVHIKVPKEDLEKWLGEGWERGMIKKKTERHNTPEHTAKLWEGYYKHVENIRGQDGSCKGLIWIEKEGKRKRIKIEDLKMWEKDGWKRWGRL